MSAPDGLPRASAASLGVDPDGVQGFLDAVAAEGLELHGFMAYRHGAVFAEGWWQPYRADRPHMLHSLVKSVTATGVGLAVDAGLVSLDDRVVDFFPDEAPDPLDPWLAAMTVRHLLTMGTGHETGLSGGQWRTIASSWVREFFKEPLVEPPGRRFIYSSATSYMLSAIVQKITGETLHRYMTPRFFEPLGIQGITWDTCPNGINSGGNGISCTTSDLVKFAAVHLQGGVWQGRRLLSAEWIEAATRPSFTDITVGSFDGRRYRQSAAAGQTVREGYGYQWWLGPAGAYYAAGLFGQYAMVFPAQDAVVVCTAAIQSGHGRLRDLAARHLLAAMGPAPLPADPARQRAMETRLAGLRLLPDPSRTASPLAQTPSTRRYAMAPNEDRVDAVSFEFSADRCVFTQSDHRGTHSIAAGLGSDIEGETTMTGNLLHHQYQPERMRVVARARWEAPDLLRMTWVFVETPFRDEVVCRFAADRVAIDRSVNVNSSGTTRPTLQGQAA